MKSNHCGRRARLLGFSLLAAVAPVLSAAQRSFVHSELQVEDAWGALEWTASQEHEFAGKPAFTDPESVTLLVRYSYYVSCYDTARHVPVWVAHVDTAQSVAAAETRTNDAWKRPSRFKPDVNVVTFSNARNFRWVSHDDFTNCNPPEFPVESSDDKLARGHMASNLEMKGHGDDEGGQLSQLESFSTANILPQIQGLNARFWQALEEDCRRLATKVGAVAVISGGLYQLPDGKPLLYTQGGVPIPIPTGFFKIIIADTDGRRTAIAYRVPHDGHLKPADREQYLVSVREIEEATGINFMPAAGDNDALEKSPQPALVELLHETAPD